MPTAAWIGFVHAWHNLAIVLKWMCISVVGIPFAAATCLLIAAAAVALVLLGLFAAFLACLVVYLTFKLIWSLLTRWPYWISEHRIWRAERRLLRGEELPITEARDFPRWDGYLKKVGTQEPLRSTLGYLGPPPELKDCTIQAVPPGYIAVAETIQTPSRLHITERFSSDGRAGPATELPRLYMKDCQVCMEEKSPMLFPLRPPTSSCEHAAVDCCKSCLAQSITMAFENNMWDDIRCPICNIKLEHKDVAEFATPDIFERYDTLFLRRTLEQELPNFRWCLGPSCTFGQEHPDDPSPKPLIVCSFCGFVACSNHNSPWHSGRTCEEYDKETRAGMSSVEKHSEKIIRKIAKRCPGCERYINKNGGCGHMTCLCGKQFCWNCLRDYPGHAWGCTRRA